MDRAGQIRPCTPDHRGSQAPRITGAA